MDGTAVLKSTTPDVLYRQIGIQFDSLSAEQENFLDALLPDHSRESMA